MKTLLIGLGAIVLAGAIWAAVPEGQDLAVSGCCKQKINDKWRRIDADFEQCKILNEGADGDNVFEPSNTYWWDVSC
jgi:hypothetical protein